MYYNTFCVRELWSWMGTWIPHPVHWLYKHNACFTVKMRCYVSTKSVNFGTIFQWSCSKCSKFNRAQYFTPMHLYVEQDWPQHDHLMRSCICLLHWDVKPRSVDSIISSQLFNHLKSLNTNPSDLLIISAELVGVGYITISYLLVSFGRSIPMPIITHMFPVQYATHERSHCHTAWINALWQV